jgi:3-deoxy-D-manno-octulosonate 8-phosphate phosphatase (KDO 8-P phosphatase)
MNLPDQFTAIKAFVFDMDGVLTDGSLLLLPGGEQARTMNIKDGYALQLAVKARYHVVIISGSHSEPCAERLEYLGIREVFMRVKNKEEVLAQYMLQHRLQAHEVLYMGDDIPDRAVMQLSALPCCPADAVPEIKAISRYISPYAGGKGCVRDVIEKVMRAQRNWLADQSDVASL